MFWTGGAFIAWTTVTTFLQMVLAAGAWGFFSVVPGQAAQAALTWVWQEHVAPYMSLFHAGFGCGSLIAPILVSWDLGANKTFHTAYIAIGERFDTVSSRDCARKRACD
jgi:hypothetical protein